VITNKDKYFYNHQQPFFLKITKAHPHVDLRKYSRETIAIIRNNQTDWEYIYNSTKTRTKEQEIIEKRNVISEQEIHPENENGQAGTEELKRYVPQTEIETEILYNQGSKSNSETETDILYNQSSQETGDNIDFEEECKSNDQKQDDASETDSADLDDIGPIEHNENPETENENQSNQGSREDDDDYDNIEYEEELKSNSGDEKSVSEASENSNNFNDEKSRSNINSDSDSQTSNIYPQRFSRNIDDENEIYERMVNKYADENNEYESVDGSNHDSNEPNEDGENLNDNYETDSNDGDYRSNNEQSDNNEESDSNEDESDIEDNDPGHNNKKLQHLVVKNEIDFNGCLDDIIDPNSTRMFTLIIDQKNTKNNCFDSIFDGEGNMYIVGLVFNHNLDRKKMKKQELRLIENITEYSYAKMKDEAYKIPLAKSHDTMVLYDLSSKEVFLIAHIPHYPRSDILPKTLDAFFNEIDKINTNSVEIDIRFTVVDNDVRFQKINWKPYDIDYFVNYLRKLIKGTIMN
jgi:hypothetical protein